MTGVHDDPLPRHDPRPVCDRVAWGCHPSDHEALLRALVTMFSGHVDGSAPLDGDSLLRMRAYADAYGTAEGPHLGLVPDWVRFVSGQ